MNLSLKTLSLACGLTLGLIPGISAETARQPQSVQVVDDVVIPVPSEIFAALDKLGGVNWQQEISQEKPLQTKDRTQLSLLFGAVVAEGFIAVQAQSQADIKELGKQVLDIATALGLRNDVDKHANAILEAADQKDWKTVRKEFDRTEKTVRESMERMRDRELSQCVSIGGWIRGTSAASGIISRNYSADRADLLSQPFMVEHFQSVIESMPGKLQKDPLIAKIAQGLSAISKVIPENQDLVSAEGSKVIHQTCSTLTALIRNPQN